MGVGLGGKEIKGYRNGGEKGRIVPMGRKNERTGK
jgi:hypothetical protein